MIIVMNFVVDSHDYSHDLLKKTYISFCSFISSSLPALLFIFFLPTLENNEIWVITDERRKMM